jgi:hypothetical protein
MSGRGSIYRRGSTWTYQLSVGAGGDRRQFKKGGFHSRREAAAALDVLLGELEAGTHVSAVDLTLDAWLDAWLDGRATADCGRRRSPAIGTSWICTFGPRSAPSAYRTSTPETSTASTGT